MNCFLGTVAKTSANYNGFDSFLKGGKVARDRACLTSRSRLFQSYVYEKEAVCPLFVFCKGGERSVSVFLSSLTLTVDFFTNKSERYSITKPFSDLYVSSR